MRHKTFSDWCAASDRLHRLGLEPSYVDQIRERMTRGAEMRGIHSWTALARTLKPARSFLFSDREWERFMLTAKCMWDAYAERKTGASAKPRRGIKSKTDGAETGWGIVRYRPGGGAPEDDECRFDGWHEVESRAKAVYQDWCRQYPDWIVAMVTPRKVKWGEAGIEVKLLPKQVETARL
jgi:hypothetical protein